MTKRKINIILAILESPNGRYYGFRITRCRDGKTVEAQVTVKASIRSALLYSKEIPGGWRSDSYVFPLIMKERELFKLPCAGGSSESIQAWVKKNLGKF